jgi:excisionase family DNA binding protein
MVGAAGSSLNQWHGRNEWKQGSVKPTFFTVAETARLLRVNAMTIYRAIREDAFPAIRVRSRYIIPAAAVERLAAEATETGGCVDVAAMAAERRLAREVARLSDRGGPPAEPSEIQAEAREILNLVIDHVLDHVSLDTVRRWPETLANSVSCSGARHNVLVLAMVQGRRVVEIDGKLEAEEIANRRIAS